MPFIGKPPAVGAYSVLDDLTASATANYSLQLNGAAFVPNSVNQLLVSLNGVIQKPGSSFVVSGNTLTFKNGGSDFALTSSDSIDFIISMGGDPLNVGIVSDGTISNSKITDMAASKLTGALPSLDGSALTGVEGNLVLLNTTTISSATAEVAFTNLFDDAYETFIIRGTEITSNASSDQDDFLAFKARGGSTTYDTNSTYGTKINTTSNANSNYTVNGAFSETRWEMTPSGHLDSTEAVPLQFQMTLPDPKGTTAGGRAFNYFLTYYSYHPYYITSHGTLWSTNNNVTGIKFKFSTNSILTGTFKLYGVK